MSPQQEKVLTLNKKNSAPSSRRSASLLYTLTLPDGTSKPVCKSMYSSTLGIRPRTIGLWLNERSSPNNVEEEPNQERHSKAPKSGIKPKRLRVICYF